MTRLAELWRAREHEREAREKRLRSYAEERAARSAARALGVHVLGSMIDGIDQVTEVTRHAPAAAQPPR